MAKKPSNRNPVQQWEVTFPKYKDANEQSLYGKVGNMENVELNRDTFVNECLPPVVYQCVCQEDHADDTKHLHCGIKLVNGITHSKLLKFIKARLPEDYQRVHISAIQSWENWLAYCMKEDPYFYQDGTLDKKKKEWWRTANGRWLIETHDDEHVQTLWGIYLRQGDERAAVLAAEYIEGTIDTRSREEQRIDDMNYLEGFL